MRNGITVRSTIITYAEISPHRSPPLFSHGTTIDEDEARGRKHMFRSLVEQESDVYYTTSRLLDDGIIDPRDTRTVLGFCLTVVHGSTVQGGNLYGVSRM